MCRKPKSNLMSLRIMVQGLKMPNLVDEYKTIFLGKRGKRWNSSRTVSLYLSLLLICFGVCQKPNSNPISLEIIAQGFKISNLVDEYKIIFLGKPGRRWNSSKTVSLYLSFLKICFKVCKKPKSNLMNLEIKVQGLKF